MDEVIAVLEDDWYDQSGKVDEIRKLLKVQTRDVKERECERKCGSCTDWFEESDCEEPFNNMGGRCERLDKPRCECDEPEYTNCWKPQSYRACPLCEHSMRIK